MSRSMLLVFLPQAKQWARLVRGLTVARSSPQAGQAKRKALAVASGTKSLGRFGCPRGDVLYLALEDTPRRMQSRLQKILRRTHGSAQGLFLEYVCPLLGQGLENHLRGWMPEHPETRLIVIDTLAKVRPPRGRHEESYAADYRVMASLKAIADECRTSLVVITHKRKQADADPLAEVSGTMGLTGAADAILVLKRERGRAGGGQLRGPHDSGSLRNYRPLGRRRRRVLGTKKNGPGLGAYRRVN